MIFPKITPEMLINGFECRGHLYLLPHNKIIAEVHVQVKPRRQHEVMLNNQIIHYPLEISFLMDNSTEKKIYLLRNYISNVYEKRKYRNGKMFINTSSQE